MLQCNRGVGAHATVGGTSVSWEALGWVWSRDIRPAARKLIAVAIADAADAEGTCRFKHKTLAAKCGVGYDSVRGHIRELEESGVLVRETRTGDDGSQIANGYRLTPSGPTHPPPVNLEPRGGGTLEPRGGGGIFPGKNHLSESPSESPEEPKEKNGQGPEGQLFDVPSPERQVWDHWLAATGTRQKLDATRKVVIRNALKLRTVEQCCLAIDGLVSDPWWRENTPRLELRYALRGNHSKGQSDEDRIDNMIEKLKASAGGSSPLSDGELLTEEQFVDRLQPEGRPRFEHIKAAITAMLEHPDDEALKADGQRQLDRMRDIGFEVVIEGQRITGYRKAGQ